MSIPPASEGGAEAQYCEYGAVLSDMLCDRLVCRIRDKGVQCRLLRETNLPFDKALEMALTDETDSRRLTDNGHVTTEKNYNVLLPTTDKSRETQESPTVNHVDRPKQNKSTQPKQTGGPKDQRAQRPELSPVRRQAPPCTLHLQRV